VAEIRKITRRPELSTFQREASTGGSATLLALAGSMNAAYERLRPAAMQKMAQEADADWAGQARRDMGNPGGTLSASTSGGGAPSSGDFDFTPFVTEGGARPDAITGMQGGFRDGLAAMFQAAPPEIQAQLKIGSGFRSNERQAELFQAAVAKYGSPEAARKWVAPPGNSQHNHGNAADLKFGSDAAREWVHANAGQFGLAFPLSHEPWHVEYAGARGGNVTVSTQSAPPTVIQTADGSLQPRLYSPGSGEFLEAYNAAAQVLYRNEAELEMSSALMNLSNQFTLDPDGFQQAAKGYMDDVLKNVPDMFRPELRAVMADQVQRRSLGILEDKQADIRQRAGNSNQALIERHSNTLSEALVAGNPDAILKAENDLRTQLAVRETLPGLAWTSEQSENIILDTRERAKATATANRNKAKVEMDRQLRLVRDAALSGQTSAYDAILMGPFTDAIDPALLEEATAARAMADGMPGFLAATPADRAATIADLRAQPVTSSMDIKTIEAFERADRLVTEAFQKDPVAAAQQFLPQKPPELPPITDPQAYGAGLKARLEYGRMLNANGYTQGVPLFTKAEREQAGALFGKGVPAEAKMVAAVAVVEALGEDAGLFFEQAKSDDRVSLVVGQMLASGGDATVGLEAMRGQEMLDAGVAKRPKVPPVQAVSTDIATALSGLMMPSSVSDVAAAILVARGHSETDLTTTEGKKQMEDAVQAALGQTYDSVSKKTYGGEQTVAGRPTLLSPDLNGEDFTRAITRSMYEPGLFDRAQGGAAAWGAAGALSVPTLGGAPIPDQHKSAVFARPFDNSGMYQLFVEVGGREVALQVEGAPLIPFLFNPRELIKATQ